MFDDDIEDDLLFQDCNEEVRVEETKTIKLSIILEKIGCFFKRKLKADVKISGRANNNISVENDGLFVEKTTNIQTDWNQTDNSAPDYLKNKPALGTMSQEDSGNYYDKTETDQAILDSELYREAIYTDDESATAQSTWDTTNDYLYGIDTENVVHLWKYTTNAGWLMSDVSAIDLSNYLEKANGNDWKFTNSQNGLQLLSGIITGYGMIRTTPLRVFLEAYLNGTTTSMNMYPGYIILRQTNGTNSARILMQGGKTYYKNDDSTEIQPGREIVVKDDLTSLLAKTSSIEAVYTESSDTSAKTYSQNNPTTLVFYEEE